MAKTKKTPAAAPKTSEGPTLKEQLAATVLTVKDQADALEEQDGKIARLAQELLEVEGLNKDLQETAEGLSEDLRSGGDVMGALRNDYDILILHNDRVEDELDKVHLRLAEALTKPKPPAPPAPTTPIGSIQLQGDLLLIGGSQFFDQKYHSLQQSHSRAGVDYKGPHAEFLANKVANLDPEILPDGTYRLYARGQPEAQTLKARASDWLKSQDDGHLTTVTIVVLNSPSLKGRDACRDAGAGVAVINGAPVLAAALTGKSGVGVSVTKDASGKVTTVHLHVG